MLEITRTSEGHSHGSSFYDGLFKDPSVVRSVFDESGRFAGVGFTSNTNTTWSHI